MNSRACAFVASHRLAVGSVGCWWSRWSYEVELRQFQSAVIWCKRFSVAFGAAPLD